MRLAIALAELNDDVRSAVAQYRAASFTDEEWAAVGDLVRLG